jgi:Domain of unknown function (DUF4440)
MDALRGVTSRGRSSQHLVSAAPERLHPPVSLAIMTRFRATRHRLAASTLIASLCVITTGCRSTPATDVPGLLQRQTQQLMDAIASGDRDPWTRYVDDEIVYSAEDGSTKSKAQLVDEVRPFPKDIWGKLRVTEFKTARQGKTAITTYVSEEDEGYFGQVIHARYRSTDTWIETGDGWRLIASHVLALRDDPPAINLAVSTLDEYVGIYSLTSEVTYTIRREGDRLVGNRTGRKPEELKVELRDCLFVPGQPRLRKIFQRDTKGAVTGFVERRESWDIAWRRLPRALSD